MTRADAAPKTGEHEFDGESREKRCRGAGSCYFPIAAGPLAVFSKRFVIEFLEYEDGRDMTNRSLLQLRFGQSLACADMSLSFVASGL